MSGEGRRRRDAIGAWRVKVCRSLPRRLSMTYPQPPTSGQTSRPGAHASLTCTLWVFVCGCVHKLGEVSARVAGCWIVTLLLCVCCTCTVHSLIKKGGKKDPLRICSTRMSDLGHSFFSPLGRQRRGRQKLTIPSFTAATEFVCLLREPCWSALVYACHVFVLVVEHAPLINTPPQEEHGRLDNGWLWPGRTGPVVRSRAVQIIGDASVPTKASFLWTDSKPEWKTHNLPAVRDQCSQWATSLLASGRGAVEKARRACCNEHAQPSPTWWLEADRKQLSCCKHHSDAPLLSSTGAQISTLLGALRFYFIRLYLRGSHFQQTRLFSRYWCWERTGWIFLGLASRLQWSGGSSASSEMLQQWQTDLQSVGAGFQNPSWVASLGLMLTVIPVPG